MRRVAILLTEAQVKLLRGAVRSHKEDMSIAGLWTETDVRMAENILDQLDQNPLKTVPSRILPTPAPWEGGHDG